MMKICQGEETLKEILIIMKVDADKSQNHCSLGKVPLLTNIFFTI